MSADSLRQFTMSCSSKQLLYIWSRNLWIINMAQDFGHVRLCQQNSPNLTKLETGAKTMFVLLPACLGACDLHLFLTKRASRNSSLLWARFGLPGLHNQMCPSFIYGKKSVISSHTYCVAPGFPKKTKHSLYVCPESPHIQQQNRNIKTMFI
jgi:hypothetical protein